MGCGERTAYRWMALPAFQDTMRRARRQVLNQAIRQALAGNAAAERRPFKLKPKRLSLRPGLDPAMLQHLEEELETESFIQKTRKLSGL